MNKHNARDYLPLVQALAEGKDVQLKHGDEWVTHEEYAFNSPVSNYRVKPEPREYWIVHDCYGNVFKTCGSEEEAKRIWPPCTISLFREVIQ